MNGKFIAVAAVSTALLAGCGNDSVSRSVAVTPVDTIVGAQFDVQVRNNTDAQPFSPLAILSHHVSYSLFGFGMPASGALELLAESGDNSLVLAEKNVHSTISASFSGVGSIIPGATETIRFEVSDPTSTWITVASMLVNTNDAFFAERIDLVDMKVGETMRIPAPMWDSGTERNTETAATMPGPAGTNGVGFSAVRDDLIDAVTSHQGIISNQDGLVGSALNASHRVRNPAATIVVTRVR